MHLVNHRCARTYTGTKRTSYPMMGQTDTLHSCLLAATDKMLHGGYVADYQSVLSIKMKFTNMSLKLTFLCSIYRHSSTFMLERFMTFLCMQFCVSLKLKGPDHLKDHALILSHPELGLGHRMAIVLVNVFCLKFRFWGFLSHVKVSKCHDSFSKKFTSQNVARSLE